MLTHWTYAPIEADAEDLFQGDILARTPELVDLLEKVHPYFLKDKFTAFVVTTQTCDLVNRSSGCKAEHINLAVVRELEPILPELIARIAGTEIQGVYRKSLRVLAINRIKKIIDQNEQSHGMFYLHPDADAGIITPSVALLRVGIAVRREHYELMKAARCGRLEPEFRNKLGWLCGNLYSRIATKDWNEAKRSKNAGLEQAKLLLRSLDVDDEKNWIPDSWLKTVEDSREQLADKSSERAIEILTQHAPLEPLEVSLEVIERVFAKAVATEHAHSLETALTSEDSWTFDLFVAVASHCASIASVDADSITESFLSNEQLVRAAIQSIYFAANKFLTAQPDMSAEELSAAFATITYQKLFAKEVRRSIRGIEGIDWQSTEPQLATIENAHLLSGTALDSVVQALQGIREKIGLVSAAKLTKRLRNEPAFTNLFRTEESAIIDEE